ncbi:MAG: hypothetical protein RR403_05560, partial [Pseudoflavonifractor sp.]
MNYTIANWDCQSLPWGKKSPVISLPRQFTDYSQSLHELSLIIGYDNNGLRNKNKKSSQHTIPLQPPLQNNTHPKTPGRES